MHPNELTDLRCPPSWLLRPLKTKAFSKIRGGKFHTNPMLHAKGHVRETPSFIRRPGFALYLRTLMGGMVGDSGYSDMRGRGFTAGPGDVSSGGIGGELGREPGQ